ncbi:MAG: glycosyltransferase family 2 protein [Candidatus Omnitrophota bacterium]
MRLRKIRRLSPLLSAKLQKKVSLQFDRQNRLKNIVMLLLFTAGVEHLDLLREKTFFLFEAAWQYAQFCWLVFGKMTRGQVWVFFLPALALDAVRYYVTNILVLLMEIGKILLPRTKNRRNWWKPPLVSVILPVYNEAGRIEKTINSIRENKYPKLEIIVVDDGSTDTTAAVCADYARKGLIRYIRKTERGGKASALNYGFRLAKGEFIVHFDAEVRVSRTAIREGLLPFQDPRVGVVSGNVKVLNDRESLAVRLQAAEYGIAISVQRRWLSLVNSLRIASGAFSVFRREALEKTMGLDPETGDDLDITLKIRKLGYKVVFAPAAVVWTHVPASFYRLFRQRIRWDACYIRLNLRKHGNPAYCRQFSWADFINYALDLVFNIILLLVYPIYIVLILGFVPQLLICFLIVPYIFYTLMNIIQLGIVTVLSDDWKRDGLLILYAPLMMFYYLLLNGERVVAYFLETFRLRYLRDGFYPQKVWDNMPRY